MGAQLDALLVKLASGGTPWKRAVDLATTANITLSGLQTIDGQTTVEGRRVLVQDQTAPAQNGVYIARTGTWTRAEDMDRDSYAQIGTVVRVMRGTANGGKLFYISAPTSGDIRIGSTSTTWSEFSAGAGTVAPTADTVPQRDAAGELYATSFQGGATGSTTVAAVGATSDITIDAGRDVILDLGSTSDEISIRASGVTQATITPGASTTTIASAQSMRVESSADFLATAPTASMVSTASPNAQVQASGAAVTIGDSDEPAALTITPNGIGGTTTIAGFQPLSLSAAGAMTVQPAQATAGAGHKLTVGGGSGQTPGTHLAGGIDVQLGQVVSNNSAGIDLYAGATNLCQIRGTLATYTEISHKQTNSALLLRALESGSQVWCQANNRVLMTQANAAAGFVDIASTRRRWYTASEGRLIRSDEAGSATIAGATTTNIVTYATTSNRRYQVFGVLTVSNDTDNEGADYWVRASFKNVAGVVTQIGATQTIAADLEDAGQTGLSAVLDFTGTTIRLRLVTDSGDTVNADGVLELYERILA